MEMGKIGQRMTRASSSAGAEIPWGWGLFRLVYLAASWRPENEAAPARIRAGARFAARSRLGGRSMPALGGGGDTSDAGKLHGDARLLGKQMEHLAHVLTVFRRQLFITQKVEDFAEDWFRGKDLGEVAR